MRRLERSYIDPHPPPCHLHAPHFPCAITVNMSDAPPRASTQSGANLPTSDTDDTPTEQYTVSSFMFSSLDTDSTLTVMFCGLRMYIDIAAVNLQNSAQKLDEYIRFLKVADAYELDGLTVEDFYDWIFEGCSSTFAQVARPTLPTKPTLADHLYPTTRCYSLHADEHDQLGLIETADDPNKRISPGTRAHEESCHSWPSFTPCQLSICADNSVDALHHAYQRVRVQVATHCCSSNRMSRAITRPQNVRSRFTHKSNKSSCRTFEHLSSSVLCVMSLDYFWDYFCTTSTATRRHLSTPSGPKFLYRHDNTGQQRSARLWRLFTKPASSGEMLRPQTSSSMLTMTRGSLISVAATRQAGWRRTSLERSKVTCKGCPELWTTYLSEGVWAQAFAHGLVRQLEV
jgi:hypothetical protein